VTTIGPACGLRQARRYPGQDFRFGEGDGEVARECEQLEGEAPDHQARGPTGPALVSVALAVVAALSAGSQRLGS
jgi:hypothetical protein